MGKKKKKQKFLYTISYDIGINHQRFYETVIASNDAEAKEKAMDDCDVRFLPYDAKIASKVEL